MARVWGAGPACALAGLAGLAAGARGGDGPAFSGVTHDLAAALVATPTGGPRLGGPLSLPALRDDGALFFASRELIFRSADGGVSAIETGTLPPPPGLGRPRDMFTRDGSLVVHQGIAGVFGELWRSADEGRTWSSISQSFPLGDGLAVSVGQTPAGIFAIAGDFGNEAQQLFTTSDFGKTWTALPVPVQEIGLGFATISAAGDLLFGSVPFFGEMWCSRDGGATWARVPAPQGQQIDQHRAFALPGGVALLGPDTIIRSVDGGLTWTSHAVSAPLNAAAEVVGISVRDGFIYLATRLTSPRIVRAAETGAGLVFVAADAGLGPPGCPDDLIVNGLAGAPAALVTLTSLGASRSTTGTSWTSTTIGPPTPVLELDARGADLYARSTQLGGVLRRPAGGSWSITTSGLPCDINGVRTVHSPAPGVVLAGFSTRGIARSTSASALFAPANVGVPQYNGTAGNQFREISDIASQNGVVLAATGIGFEFFNQAFQFSGGGMLRSLDQGATWQAASAGFPIRAFNIFNQPVFDPAISVSALGSVVLVSTLDNGIVRSTSDGASWAVASTGLPVLAGSRPNFSRFVRSGPAIVGGAIGFGVALEGTIDFGIYRSIDNGLSWAQMPMPIPPFTPVSDLAVFEGAIYAAADRLYQSSDDGQTWQPAMVTGLPAGVVEALAVADGALHVSVRERGVFRLGAACYPNCDGSTIAPALNALDFACFLDRYRAGDPYANCDGSTVSPAINALDFGCFLTRYRAGCAH